MALDKPIEEITQDDLQVLVDEQETESRSLDYKVMLNLDADKAKEDFRKDVTAFANSAGGDLVVGIRDENGVPVELCGFDLVNQSQEQYRLRLLEILQSRIKPRIQSVSIRLLPLLTGQWVAIIRIPRSFAKPHQVEIGNKDFQFWFRHDGGNQRMDVDELREAVLVGDMLAERRHAFRVERIGNVVTGETPIPLGNGAKTVLHIVPLGAFSGSTNVDVVELGQKNLNALSPITPGVGYFRHNFDGFLTSLTTPHPANPNSYLQIFRNGIVEAVDECTTQNSRKVGVFPATSMEKKVIPALSRVFTLLQEQGVTPPLLIMLTLVGVAGLNITRNDYGFLSQSTPIDRDVLMVPEVLVDNYPSNPDKVLRPIFDAIWNAAGYAACPNYDEAGNWLSQDSR